MRRGADSLFKLNNHILPLPLNVNKFRNLCVFFLVAKRKSGYEKSFVLRPRNMATLTTVRLSKGDSPNWGFRLQGGKDFGTPLVIQKVSILRCVFFLNWFCVIFFAFVGFKLVRAPVAQFKNRRRSAKMRQTKFCL